MPSAGAELEFWKRVKYSFYGTLVFLLLTSPLTYQFTQSLFGDITPILQNGNPTSVGLLFHAGLFFLTILALMMLPKH